PKESMSTNQETIRSTDMARTSHWESVWRDTRSVPPFSTRNYYDFRLASLFRTLAGPGSRVLEVGCGGSRWIGFFDRVLGRETWGIDYSPAGLELTRQSNSDRESNLRLIQGDFFDESLLPGGHFDFVYSLGFVEHFADVSLATRRIAEVMKNGGRVMTLIPNFASLYGTIQKAINPRVFEKHVVMRGTELDAHHAAAGLVPEMPAQFWGCFGPGVVNFGAPGKWILPPLKFAQHAFCWSLHALHATFESPYLSPYVVGVYRKP